MNIHDVNKKAPAHKRRTRRGRGNGNGLGKTAGRGHKGAKARSGWKTRYGYEGGQMPIARRLPKRGFRNSIHSTRYDVVNLKQLEAVFSDGDTVDIAAVRSRAGLEPRFGKLKVLGTGELTKKLTIVAEKFSRTAREKIEKAGGTCTEPEKKSSKKKDGNEASTARK